MIISIDPGIKNLAVCALDKSPGGQWHIEEWEVLDIANERKQICNKSECSKNPKLVHQGQLWCTKCAKRLGIAFGPKDYHKLKSKKNLSKKDKLRLDKDYGTSDLGCIGVKCLVPVEKRSVKSISEPEIADALCQRLTSLLDITKVKYVIIENQLGPHAVRMRCIQAMITMLFVSKNATVEIIYASAKNKLLGHFDGKSTYAERKQAGIKIVSELVEANAELKCKFYNSKKKDDLADAFLQANWFIKSRLNSEIAFSVA